MERLTEKHYGADDYYMKCSEECESDHCIDCPAFEALVDRLGAYEDTGLSPSGVEALKLSMMGKAVAERYGTGNGSVLGRHSGVADCIASEIAGLPAADVIPTWWARHAISSGEFGSCRNPISMLSGWPLAMADSTETVQSVGNTPQLVVRTKYAGDVYTALVELGWEPDTAAAFLDEIPDANGGLKHPCRERQSILYCNDEPFVYADPEGDDDNATD